MDDLLACPACGMAQDEWPNRLGYMAGEERFCCQGCAEDAGCICDERSALNTVDQPKTANEEGEQEAREQIPNEGIAGKEEFLGQEAGGSTRPTPDHAEEQQEPNDQRL